MNLVITVSRRFGTGASIVARELSGKLGIPVYDKAFIEERLHEHSYETEADAIRMLAKKPCIILGRCASESSRSRGMHLIYTCAPIRRIEFTGLWIWSPFRLKKPEKK